jgi:hypothetical protein
MRTRGPALATALLATLVLTGCDSLKVQYEEMALEDLVKTGVADATHHYKIPAPTVAAARRNTGIIREDSLFLIVVGPDLKSVVRTYTGPDVQWGVRLVKEPRTHIIVERVFTKDGEIDLFEGVEQFRFDFPRFVPSTEIPLDEFPVTTPLAVLEESPRLVYLHEMKVNKMAPADELQPVIAEAFGGRIPKRVFLLEDPETERSFVVTNRDVSTLLLLDWFAAEPKKFKGGVVVQQIFEKEDRNATNALGAVEVRWMDLGGGLFCKSRPNVTD